MIEGIEVKIGHQVGLYVIDSLGKASEKLIKVFLVQEHLMAVVTTIFKALFTLSDGNKVIIASRRAHVKEISAAFAGLDALGENALIVTAITVSSGRRMTVLLCKVVVVRHRCFVLSDRCVKNCVASKLNKKLKYPNEMRVN